ncbi:MAG: 2OG-Fe(II) oxygenase, partial [Marinomonas sp.]
MLHRGNVPHAAHPITSGTRTNFVLWLYGDRGQIPLAGAQTTLDPRQRWSTPQVACDEVAPF